MVKRGWKMCWCLKKCKSKLDSTMQHEEEEVRPKSIVTAPTEYSGHD